MSGVTRSAAAEQPPILNFFPHRGSRTRYQLRKVEPRSHTSTDKIKISMFPRDDDPSEEEIIVKSYVAGFQIIEKNIAPLLVDELVNFLVDSWRQDQRHGLPEFITPKEHQFYDVLTSEDESKKSLNFSYWFYLAVWWGPGHPDLKTIRKDISSVWGVDFPADSMFYPSGISDKVQKKLYAGIHLALEHEGSALAGGRPTSRPRTPSRPKTSTRSEAISKAQVSVESINQPLDVQMQARQQEIVNAIENNPVGSVLGKFVPNIDPKFLKSGASANDNKLGKLKADLTATRKELQQSRSKATALEGNLSSLQTAFDASEATLHKVQQKVSDLESDLERVQKESHQLEIQNTKLTERVDKLEANLNRARKYTSDVEDKLSKSDDRMDVLETRLGEANERAKKAIEMSAFNHALIEKRLRGETPEQDDDDNEG